MYKGELGDDSCCLRVKEERGTRWFKVTRRNEEISEDGVKGAFVDDGGRLLLLRNVCFFRLRYFGKSSGS